MVRWSAVSLLLVVLLVGLCACGSSGASASGSSAVNITIQTVEFGYKPNTVRANPGQTVNLTLQNTGALDHTFVLPAVGANYKVGFGKTIEQTFIAPTTPGTYPFYCDVPGHKEAGMTGTLIVQ